MVIHRIGTLSLARVLGAIYGAFGALVGGVISLLVMFGNPIEIATSSFTGPLVGLGAIVFIPLAYGLTGFLTGAGAAFFYNSCAELVGGIELHVGPSASG